MEPTLELSEITSESECLTYSSTGVVYSGSELIIYYYLAHKIITEMFDFQLDEPHYGQKTTQ